ncbi:hypothetical protein SUGI_0573250 [Cryptomeria japonica]|nr:hypothetical protein SUGI_0573250 [Cryptomeria japonica]
MDGQSHLRGYPSGRPIGKAEETGPWNCGPSNSGSSFVEVSSSNNFSIAMGGIESPPAFAHNFPFNRNWCKAFIIEAFAFRPYSRADHAHYDIFAISRVVRPQSRGGETQKLWRVRGSNFIEGGRDDNQASVHSLHGLSLCLAQPCSKTVK